MVCADYLDNTSLSVSILSIFRNHTDNRLIGSLRSRLYEYFLFRIVLVPRFLTQWSSIFQSFLFYRRVSSVFISLFRLEIYS